MSATFSSDLEGQAAIAELAKAAFRMIIFNQSTVERGIFDGCPVLTGQSQGPAAAYAAMMVANHTALVLAEVEHLGAMHYRYIPETCEHYYVVRRPRRWWQRGLLVTQTSINRNDKRYPVQSLERRMRRGVFEAGQLWDACNTPRELSIIAAGLPKAQAAPST